MTFVIRPCFATCFRCCPSASWLHPAATKHTKLSHHGRRRCFNVWSLTIHEFTKKTVNIIHPTVNARMNALSWMRRKIQTRKRLLSGLVIVSKYILHFYMIIFTTIVFIPRLWFSRREHEPDWARWLRNGSRWVTAEVNHNNFRWHFLVIYENTAKV